MKNKRNINFLFIVIAFPIGMGLLREFDLETKQFKNPILGIIYLVTFVGAIYFAFKRKPETKDPS